MNDTVKKAIKKLNLFDGIVGQAQARKRIEFYFDSYHTTHIFPNLMFNAPKGQGKSTIAREAAKGLIKFDEKGQVEMNEQTGLPKRKAFIEINCSTLKSVKQFINGLIIPYVQDKDVTLLFDEASCIPTDITMALLTITNPNPERKTSFSLDEYVCDFDFRKQTFLFATSEPQRVFHALTSRLTRIDLEEYNQEEMAQIVQRGAKQVKFEENTLEEIASVLRGNAREAQKMAEDICAFLKNATKFTARNWKSFKNIFGIKPLGINPIELNILKLLAADNDGTSLTCLAAKTGLSREALQRDYELFLLKNGLVSIETSGRLITAKGLNYLNDLNDLNDNPVFRSGIVQ